MKRVWIVLLALTLTAALAVVAWAQADRPQATAAADEASAAFVTIDLAAGFPLDPMLISLNGGGDVAASTLSEACNGYITIDPTVAVDWTGESDFVEAFFYSDHDPVLVVQTPDGAYLCNDDANAVLLDPVIEISAPAQGRYHIWVGSHAADQLVPGILVLTTRHEVNIGTFSLENLITRHPIAEDHLEVHEVHTEVLPSQKLEPGDVEADAWQPGDDPIQHSAVVSGTLPAFDLSIPGRLCNGFIHTFPDYVVNVTDEPDHLRFMFEGDGDATLIVEDPAGAVHCNDDHAAGENLNPVVDLTEPAAGHYYVFIGRVMLEDEVKGVLTISESVALQPAVLKEK